MDAASPGARSVLVVVLGDLGRSPRMLRQALRFAEEGTRVTLAGFVETPVAVEVLQHPGIKVRPISDLGPAPAEAGAIRFLAWTAARVAWLHLTLLRALVFAGERPEIILVQNPPSLPTLWCAALAARLRRARFVVDWHNYGFSLLALRPGTPSWLLRWAERYELWAGGRADAGLCVSEAMAADLERRFGGRRPVVLPDRPRTVAPLLGPAERRALLEELIPGAPPAALTLLCPTSWTRDEDIGLLFEALALREEQGGAEPILVLISGEGPLKAEGERQIAALGLRSTMVRTLFLPPGDYRGLLRAVDLGLSLHRSASGLDLPMKIVDFFEAATPVLALDYGPCLREQLGEGADGRTFRTAAELERLLAEAASTDLAERLRERAPERTLWAPAWRTAWAEARAQWRGGPGQ